MSYRAISGLARSLTPVPVALLFHIGAAGAEDSAQSLLQQPSELVAWMTATVSAPANAQHSARAARTTGDAQEQARRLLLGVTTVSAPPNAQHSARAARTTGDAQEQARQLLLGVTTQTPARPQPGVSTASGNRARR